MNKQSVGNKNDQLISKISLDFVLSNRFGRSLEINNISSEKICSYSCRHCIYGTTKQYSIARKKYYDPILIFKEVQQFLGNLSKDSFPDYIVFHAKGEPTLDIQLGETIKKLKFFKIPIAVVTNATLLKYDSVRVDLQYADCVSVKIDFGCSATWEAMNWPMPWLSFGEHINALHKFRSAYLGRFITETTLVRGVNDSSEAILKISDLVLQLKPFVAYLSVPALTALFPAISPDEDIINKVCQIFSLRSLMVLLLNESEYPENSAVALFDADVNCITPPEPKVSETNIIQQKSIDLTIIDSSFYGKLKYQLDRLYIRPFHL